MLGQVEEGEDGEKDGGEKKEGIGERSRCHILSYMHQNTLYRYSGVWCTGDWLGGKQVQGVVADVVVWCRWRRSISVNR